MTVVSAAASVAPSGLHATATVPAVKRNLGNKVTSDVVQAHNTAMVGVGRALAGLETGGVYVNRELIKQFDRLGLQEGDSEWTRLRKLACLSI